MKRNRGAFRAAVMAIAIVATLLGGAAVAGAQEEPLSVELTVDPVGTVNRQTGQVTISGTMTCTGTADFEIVESWLSAELRQVKGRLQAFEWSGTNDPCNSTWSVTLWNSGPVVFGPGKANLSVYAAAWGGTDCYFDDEWWEWVCNDWEYDSTDQVTTVRLRQVR